MPIAACIFYQHPVRNPWPNDNHGQRPETLGSSLQNGFTIIELLIIIAIIGLLATIAIPQFITYRSKGIDSQIKSDLRNAAGAMEAYFETNQAYPSSVAAISTLGFKGSAGIALSVTNVTATSYQLTATKSGGSQVSFMFDSSTGAIQ